jgi:hypothetical protein
MFHLIQDYLLHRLQLYRKNWENSFEHNLKKIKARCRIQRLDVRFVSTWTNLENLIYLSFYLKASNLWQHDSAVETELTFYVTDLHETFERTFYINNFFHNFFLRHYFKNKKNKVNNHITRVLYVYNLNSSNLEKY